VRDVVAAADMVEVVSGRTPLRRASGSRFTGRCPFHEEKTPSFSVNPVEKLYYCFGCGKGGDVISFVRETENLDFVGAVEWLADRFRVPIEVEEASPQIEAERRRRDRLYTVLDQTATYFERLLWEGDAGATVREYLAALEERNPVSEDPSEPADAPTAPKNVSLTDPAARWTAAPGGPAFFAYSTNYLIDLQAGIIVDVEATPAHRTQEVNSTRKMIDRVEERFDLKPKRLVGDTAYGTAPMLGWMVEDKQIDPHVPVWDKSERKDDTLSSSVSALDFSDSCRTHHASVDLASGRGS